MISYQNAPIVPVSRKKAPLAWELWDGKAKTQLSLGRLEEIAVDIVCIRDELLPTLSRPLLLLFAADHGIVAEGVTASPQEITWQQCLNFANGGGAIGLMCSENGIDLRVVDVGVRYQFDPHDAIEQRKVAWGTKSFLSQPAMEVQECNDALLCGQHCVRVGAQEGRTVIAFGEMGVGNTSSASALFSCISKKDVSLCTGLGSGLDQKRLAHKCAIIFQALHKHGYLTDPFEILRHYGGLEIAAIVGGMLEAASQRMVILVDGFITSVALLVARLFDPHVTDYALYCHQSKEAGHALLLQELGGNPYLHLGMCLGEGTGAALGWVIIRQAVSLYTNMTSFSHAQVTDSVSLLKKQGVNLHEI